MSAALELPATEPADDEAKRLAERAETERASDEAVARTKAAAVDAKEHVFAIMLGERPGNLDEWKRKLSEAVDECKKAVRRRNRFLDRYAREDAGEARPVPALRETVARDRISVRDYERTMRDLFPDDQPFGREDLCAALSGPFGERLMRAFGLGDDLRSAEAMADAIAVTLPAVGVSVPLERERVLRVVEADESHPIRWAIVSPKIPAPPFPTAPDLAPRYARAMELRAAFLEDQGIRDAPTREEEHLARHWAWQRLRAEVAQAEEHRGKSLTQVGRELYRAGLSGWVHAEDAA